MKFITTQAEIDNEKKLHKGQTKYKLFTADGKNQNIIEYFWADTSTDAYNRLLKYRADNKKEDVYFSEVYRIICQNDDGTVTVCDHVGENFEDEFGDIDEKINISKLQEANSECILKDMKFFIEHYDRLSNTSHMRCESWSLDTHIIGDLEFNIPILMNDKQGIAQPFIEQAAKQGVVGDKEQFEAAKKIWNGHLEDMLHHVWLYGYYMDFGIINTEWSDDKKNYLKDFPVPKKEGRLDEIDYEALGKLQQEQWNAIWDWMKEFGQNLWT